MKRSNGIVEVVYFVGQGSAIYFMVVNGDYGLAIFLGALMTLVAVVLLLKWRSSSRKEQP